MISNSQIFSTTLFGKSSSKTADDLVANDTIAQEKFLKQSTASSLGTTVPRIPSNQKIMKD